MGVYVMAAANTYSDFIRRDYHNFPVPLIDHLFIRYMLALVCKAE